MSGQGIVLRVGPDMTAGNYLLRRRPLPHPWRLGMVFHASMFTKHASPTCLPYLVLCPSLGCPPGGNDWPDLVVLNTFRPRCSALDARYVAAVRARARGASHHTTLISRTLTCRCGKRQFLHPPGWRAWCSESTDGEACRTKSSNLGSV